MQVKINDVAELGPNIQKGEIKILKYNTDNNPMTLDKETLEELESFTHLGNIIDERGGYSADVKARINRARTTFLQLKTIWNGKLLSTNIKVDKLVNRLDTHFRQNTTESTDSMQISI
ncbi:unnamed protein product [Schistosoma margrebowiei]|uniref:Uncharacterized protein n=1 Tax=Schistosoma margrebowiei TaxID=48269 RepID=A0A183M819_9TREM|nr:unnamed protein product [Schistosoma margrebowiei]